ncbi:NAD(P)-dependent oxidoreductase [Candidatus Poriferisocius sp.]|uniref:NAD(P)-dependent oxidoreductase n=1 Tax=Candidatus Poriferisocius sp. TaxID=3101276 RepID=UPI003B010C88
MRVLHHMEDGRLDSIIAQFEDVEFVYVPRQGDIPEGASGDVLLTIPRGYPNLAELLDRGVEWVHVTSTGIDSFPLELLGDRVMTCSRGSSAIGISEWCLAMMLAFEKDLPHVWLNRPPERWFTADLGALYGKTLGLIGLGGIGTAVARRALAFEMSVLALRRTAAPSPMAEVEIARSLEELLERSDHIVVAAPATAATHHLLDADALAKTKPGAHIINIARGDLIDQVALRAALDNGHIARASLDTVEPEPLPEGHWLYDHPQVRLSAHVSWCMPESWDFLMAPFADNLQRRLDGHPLEGIVNLDEEY